MTLWRQPYRPRKQLSSAAFFTTLKFQNANFAHTVISSHSRVEKYSV
jgi:hypothetical protein